MSVFALALEKVFPTPAPPPAPRVCRWPTPGLMARELDRTTIQTPALDLIDAALVDVYQGRTKRLIISMPPQEGKALALDTPIATPSGWTTMGALAVGDEVFDRHGVPCRVTWVSPTWTGRPCYTVRTGDGEAIVADAAHEWVARIDPESPERIRETTDLARRRSKNLQIVGPEKGLTLPDADLPLDPYTLGVWLGDGHTTAAMLTCHPDDSAILDRIRSTGTPVRKLSARYAWTMAPEGGSSKASPARQALVGLGVWGNKHIPDAYLRASREQRLALLQGLVDTDGYVDPRGQVEFCSISRRLAEDVQHLVFTLGAKATLRTGRATIAGKDCGEKYRVRFFMAGAAYLPRKAARCADSTVAATRYVWAEPTDSVPVRCIEVDSPDHTYLAGRTLLPTHNSQRTSRRFPTWCLHQNPDLRIAIASYEFNTARRWGKAIRNDITTHSKKLDLAVEQGSSSANEWTLDGHLGGVYSVGIGGPLTSRSVDIMLIDDPIKDREQADSEVYRNRVWEWWTDVVLTRLPPGAPVIVILTRWHHDDLAGRLVAAEDGDDWRVINIPAQADHRPDKGETDPLGREPGEWLVSTRGRTAEDWEAKRIAVGARTFTSLYQGRPTPDAGDVFNGEWWRTYETPLWVEQPDGSMHVPGGGTLIASWDMAFKDTKGSDFVVGQVWLRRGADAYLLDQVRDRMSFTATVPAVEQLAAKWPQAHAKLVEDKANGTAVLDTLRKKVPGLIPITPTESKYARANAIAPFVQAGNIHLPAPQLAPWVGGLMGECAAFPNGSHDDQVDALSQALARLYLGSGALDYLDRAASICPACSLPNVLGALTCFQCGTDLPATQPLTRPEPPDAAGQQPVPGKAFGLILPDHLNPPA